jgi:hypothetical protein
MSSDPASERVWLKKLRAHERLLPVKKKARVCASWTCACTSLDEESQSTDDNARCSGTGASAIYALLGCALDARWRFTCTGEPGSVPPAQFLAQPVPQTLMPSRLNMLAPSSTIRRIRRCGSLAAWSCSYADPSSPCCPLAQSEPESLVNATSLLTEACSAAHVATMCNPPFYSSAAEMQESADFKQQGPSAVSAFERGARYCSDCPSQVCRGTDGEMITQGGEEAFVGRMIDESCEAGRAENVVCVAADRPTLSKLTQSRSDGSRACSASSRAWARLSTSCASRR